MNDLFSSVGRDPCPGLFDRSPSRASANVVKIHEAENKLHRIKRDLRSLRGTRTERIRETVPVVRGNLTEDLKTLENLWK
ncbi:MAG: hypothetical protein IT427_05810 [Pirellulales bacterium]|nr:hypothetical protein [Pirellulales bacterium]